MQDAMIVDKNKEYLKANIDELGKVTVG